ncbi:MAG: TFIIB-type zinc ribbon-containing protein [Nitrososphaerota archaeon]
METICPECGSSAIIHDFNIGEVVCGRCGLVIDTFSISDEPEWRAFDLEEERGRKRVGMPTSCIVHDKNLPTSIDVGRDARGKKLPRETRLNVLRLRALQARNNVRNAKERNLARAMLAITKICGNLQIPQPVAEEAAVIYRKALEKNLIKGREISAIAAAVVYIACHIQGIPKTLKEIAAHSSTPMKDISRCFRLITRELNIKTPTMDPLLYLARISNAFKIGGDVETLAARIIRTLQEDKAASGLNPKSLSATAFYMACKIRGLDITQKDVAKAAGVTEATIRNTCRRIMRRLNVESLFEEESPATGSNPKPARNFACATRVRRKRRGVTNLNDVWRLRRTA